MPPRADPLDAGLVLDFYDRHARDLPWRRPDATPWAVLVSEVMLQQTPVGRVLPVYGRWLERWPRPADLAAEPPGAAIRAWDRLGYPRRALRLHAAAVAITTEYGGTVPSEVESLLRLPGIGEYTARAVAAFAFGTRVPVVDTNVRRVLARVVRGVDEPRASATAADQTLSTSCTTSGWPPRAVAVWGTTSRLSACPSHAPTTSIPSRGTIRISRSSNRSSPMYRPAHHRPSGPRRRAASSSSSREVTPSTWST